MTLKSLITLLNNSSLKFLDTPYSITTLTSSTLSTLNKKSNVALKIFISTFFVRLLRETYSKERYKTLKTA